MKSLIFYACFFFLCLFTHNTIIVGQATNQPIYHVWQDDEPIAVILKKHQITLRQLLIYNKFPPNTKLNQLPKGYRFVVGYRNNEPQTKLNQTGKQTTNYPFNLPNNTTSKPRRPAPISQSNKQVNRNATYPPTQQQNTSTSSNSRPVKRPNQNRTRQPVKPAIQADKVQPINPKRRKTIHQVQAKETLYAIARQYNIPPKKLITFNKLTPPFSLFKGQKIKIPTIAELNQIEETPKEVNNEEEVATVSTDEEDKVIEEEYTPLDEEKDTAIIDTIVEPSNKPAEIPVITTKVKEDKEEDLATITEEGVLNYLIKRAILITGLASLVVLSFILIKRVIRTKKVKRIKELQYKYRRILGDLIQDYIILDDGNIGKYSSKDSYLSRDHILVLFSPKELDNPFNRNILLQEILQLHANLSGSIGTLLEGIYLLLDFAESSFAKLRSNHVATKVKGIFELTEMNITEAKPDILRLVNNSNLQVRSQARVSMAKLDEQHPLAFLSQVDVDLTNWEQMTILEHLQKIEYHNLPDFSQWLRTDNDSIVIFAIRLIQVFHQTPAFPKLIALLDHPRVAVQLALVEAIKELKLTKAVPALEKIYKHSPYDSLKEKAFKAIKNIEDTTEEISYAPPVNTLFDPTKIHLT